MESSTVGHAPLLPGVIVAGRYEIQALLGSGGMGQVYRAMDKELHGELVALKLLHHNLSQEQAVFERFRNEVSVARSLAHPNIVRTYDLGKAPEGFYYISMEYIQGQSLKEKLEAEGALTLEDAVRVLSEVLQAVSYAHSRGIIHRDLKPANILLSASGEVRLADFGTARLLKSQMELTPTGHIVGTPYYMSPEQVRGEDLTPACDIYSLGIIGYELASGRRPFEGENLVTTAYKHLTEPLPPMSEGDLVIPAWYEEIIRKATAKEVGERFSSAQEFARALKRSDSGESAPADATMVNRLAPGTAVSPSAATPAGDSLKNLAVIFFGLIFVALLVVLGRRFLPSDWKSENVQRKQELNPAMKETLPEEAKEPPVAARDEVAAYTPTAPPGPLSREEPPSEPLEAPIAQPQSESKKPPASDAGEASIAMESRKKSENPTPPPRFVEEPPQIKRTGGELYFRIGGEMTPSDTIPFSALDTSRWVCTLDPEVLPRGALSVSDARLVIIPTMGKPISVSGSVLSLGTKDAPEIRIGGGLEPVKALGKGTYRAEVRLGKNVLAESQLTIP